MDFYRTYSEAEAFSHAQVFYQSLEGNFPGYAEARESVVGVENLAFRPALELQVVGLSLLAGKPRNEIYLPASFAFYVVDHLAMGWCALLASQLRVAYSLCRGAVEASIFEVASSVAPSKFSDLWGTRAGTGGGVLPQIAGTIPEKQHAMFAIAWDLTKAIGHASFAPVLSPAQVLRDTGGRRVGVMTFGGPYLPVNKEALEHLGFLYGLGATAGLVAMEIALATHFGAPEEWRKRYENLMQATKTVADQALKKLDLDSTRRA